MSISYTDEEIARFLDGEMTAAEGKAIEQAAQEITSLAERIAQQRALRASLRELDRQEVRAGLKAFAREHPVSLKARKKPVLPWLLAAAASVALLLLLDWDSLFTTAPELSQYYIPYPGPSVQRGEGVLTPAFQLYKEARYQESIPLLIELFEQPEAQPRQDIPLLIGSAYLLTERPEAAYGYFRRMRQVADTALRAHGIWYESLALIEMHEQAQAVQQLDSLTRANTSYRDYGKGLLEALQ